MILVYALSNQWATNISRRTLSELQKLLKSDDILFLPIIRWPRPFFHKYIDRSHYSLIIGLGDGTKFSNKIHIETQAKNAYYDQSIYPFSPIFLDLNLPNVDIYDPNFFQISSNMGTHNCNWMAYSTQLYLNQHSSDTLHLFLHLPPGSNAAILAQKIFELIKNNNIF